MCNLSYPDGWTCIGCGIEYLEDTTGEQVANCDEGTLCFYCLYDNGLYSTGTRWNETIEKRVDVYLKTVLRKTEEARDKIMEESDE